MKATLTKILVMHKYIHFSKMNILVMYKEIHVFNRLFLAIINIHISVI